MYPMPDLILEEGIQYLRKSDPDIDACLEGRTAAVLTFLTAYIEEIELFNPVYGLVGVKDRQELVIRHILDSLSPLGIICRFLNRHPDAAVADVGSGAGLPGIPLAICLPYHTFTLIERMERRVKFLSNIQAVLGLPNVSVEAAEMERAGPGRFKLITFRAFKLLKPALLKSLFRLLKPEGIIAAYKGRRDKIADEMGSVENLTGSWEAVPVKVPFLEEERHLVIFNS